MKINLCFLISLIFIFSFSPQEGGAETRVTTEKIIKYRQNQEVDLTGSTIAGKIRTPEIFYIFQRKRSEGEDFLKAPLNLNYQRGPSWTILQKTFLQEIKEVRE